MKNKSGNKKATTNGKDYAGLFRKSMQPMREQYRRPASIEIPGVFNEDGSPYIFEFLAERVDFNALIYSGEMPEIFAQQVFKQRNREESAEEMQEKYLDEATEDQKRKLLEFQSKIALRCCVEPRLVFREARNEKEVDLRECPFGGDLIVCIFQYALGLSPDVPVALTDGGETSIDEVADFHREEQRANVQDAGSDGDAVRPATV